MTLVPGVPNIRVIIREASDENLVVGVPNISVKILDGDQYNVNMTANSVTTLRTGSFSTYADSAGFAQTASYALVAQTLIGSIESASYAYTSSVAISSSYATSASYAPTILPSGIISSSTQVDYTQIQNQPTTIPTASYVLNAVSSSFATTSSYALNAGAGSGFPFSGSAVITGSLLVSQSGVVISGSLNATQGITGSLNGNADTATTASYVNYNNVDGKPSLISSSLQINTGSFSGSFTGTLIGTSSWASNAVTSSFATTASYASNAELLDGINSTTFATTGSNTFVGIQTISTSTNSTNYTDGALIIAGGVGIGKNVNISGSLNVSGVLTALSMSTQYVTSSQYVVGTSRIILNDDDLVRFAGISVIDSGSTYGTGSLLWDSLNNRWIYEADDQSYNSAVLIAGPKNTGALGDETGLISGRIPVATGDDHIDTALASSSVYIDFTNRKTYIEAGLYVTGSITASNNISGTLLGTASWATNTISSSYAQTSSLAYQVSVYTGSVASGSVSYTGSFTGSFIGDGALLTNVASCIVSGSPPTSNVETGDLWYDDDTGKTYIYYTSASVSSWVLQADPTYDPGTIIQAATASLALAIPMSAPVTPQTGSLYFSGSYLFIYDGTQYKSASLN